MTGKWIDISQPLSKEIAHWAGDTPFSYETAFTKEKTGSVNIGKITTSLHTGTHVDAPFHFLNEALTIDELDISLFIGRARVIDVSGFPEISRKTLEEFQLQGAERLLLKTAVPNKPETFPDSLVPIQEDCAAYLEQQGIFLIGVDVPSVDNPDSKDMTAHHALHAHGVHILENIMLDHVEEGDYELIALPLRIKGADGSPVRAVLRKIQGGEREW
ncbi:arylformamidase [Metabacillus sp. GX 13764]|uniref:arylformamidase n=1 Tax=Metabacillus kandeliae TaxID=2900151 RepID=UPI001E5BC4EC|nr:arylformamidase [Metabacillus kandeliae]MCD7035668.1 arylformamidase [Metabacillus kandeliae]